MSIKKEERILNKIILVLSVSLNLIGKIKATIEISKVALEIIQNYFV